MYTLLIGVLIALSVSLIVRGVQRRAVGTVVAGSAVLCSTALFFWGLDILGELLWFKALGYGNRFWTLFVAQVLLFLCGAAYGFAVTWLCVPGERDKKSRSRPIFGGVGAVMGGFWILDSWDVVLPFVYQAPSGRTDPLFGLDTSFYLFSLPFLDDLLSLTLLLILLSMFALFFQRFVRVRQGGVKIEPVEQETGSAKRDIPYRTIGLLMVFVGIWKYIDRFHLLNSELGAVSGAGWTDVHVLLPVYSVLAGATAFLGLMLCIPPIRRKWIGRVSAFSGKADRRFNLFSMRVAGIGLASFWVLGQIVIPGFLQWVIVEPNEITLEEPYIARNIEFTRYGFRLHEVEEREFPAAPSFDETYVRNNPAVFNNVRLWDWRALDAVYKQFQEIRLYYEFVDVDIDRYVIDGKYRQVMVAARELELSNLPSQSQTFINRYFKYTHGHGITLTTVNEFTPEGLPRLLIKDLPPKSAFPSLTVDVPQIYFGELTSTYAVANTKEQEFDYPSGEDNVYIRYSGGGGVQLKNLWYKFLFGWKFGGTRFFFSSYPTTESRILFHREIRDRLTTIAPFLKFDRDPYIVLSNGKLYWFVDAYTTSETYPYSKAFNPSDMGWTIQGAMKEQSDLGVLEFQGKNYVRNSVKALVDAFEGSVRFYVFEPDDPIIRIWSNVFPGLFQSRDAMPTDLANHVRYPSTMLLLQGLMYAKYHMANPRVFYHQEDLWVRATEKYYNDVEAVQPYYIMWERPESGEQEFVIMLPFTPKNRQVMIGWIAGMCDGENYGRFLSYKFPKERRVLGPQQFETKIDQDRHLSGQLTLWNQRGSNVIRGNVLAIPVEDTLIYVEPIYLQAETAAYPELRLVVVMHGDRMSYGETLDRALYALFEDGTRPLESDQEERAPVRAPHRTFSDLVKQAREAFDNYISATGEKRFQQASKALEELEESLEELHRVRKAEEKAARPDAGH